MSEKIIIENRTYLPMGTVLGFVQRVIDMGKVSENGKSYCYITTFKNVPIAVSARRNKASDSFVVWEQPNEIPSR